MEEYKVGEVFQFGKKKLKCVKGCKCSNCVMSDLSFEGCEFISIYVGACAAKGRKDHTEVIFIEVKEENNGSISNRGRLPDKKRINTHS